MLDVLHTISHFEAFTLHFFFFLGGVRGCGEVGKPENLEVQQTTKRLINTAEIVLISDK